MSIKMGSFIGWIDSLSGILRDFLDKSGVSKKHFREGRSGLK
jgi:hypothetical protein